MKRENILIIVFAVVIGLIGGFLIFSLSNKKEEIPPTGVLPSGSGSPVDYQQRIAELEKVVANDPKNLQAWTMLANDYYDTDQPQKAIDAYGKALELGPNNPNLLTDQGVMYKRLGENNKAQANLDKAQANFEKALVNFQKAQSIDPKHLQSLYNIGIIYAENLKQPDKALKTWNHYLELDSTSPAAQQVKRMIEQIKPASQNIDNSDRDIALSKERKKEMKALESEINQLDSTINAHISVKGSFTNPDTPYTNSKYEANINSLKSRKEMLEKKLMILYEIEKTPKR